MGYCRYIRILKSINKDRYNYYLHYYSIKQSYQVYMCGGECDQTSTL